MNKLDYLDVKFGGEMTLGDLFTEMAKMDAPKNFMAKTESEPVELKATTIRLPVDLLEAYDTVLAHFGLTRQDTFAHIVSDFIATSIAGYVNGLAEYASQSGIQYEGISSMAQLISHEYMGTLDSMTDDERVKALLYSLSVKAVKDLTDAKN